MKKITNLLVAIMCFLSLTLSAQDQLRCKGTSKSGSACKSTIVSKKTGYCNAHDPNRAKCSGVNSKGQPCGMIPLKNSSTCRHHSGVVVKKER